MDAEIARTLLLSLPHVVETAQWGGVIFWVGDKAIGGKMFGMMNPEGAGPPMSFAAGEERFAELCEQEGIIPAPYFARIFWVSAERWSALRDREWEQDLTAAHARTFAKLPSKTRMVLALPKAEQRKVIAERRAALAAKEALKSQRVVETSGAAAKSPRKLKR